MPTIYIPGPRGAPVGICPIGSLHPRRILYYAPAEAAPDALGAPPTTERRPVAAAVSPPFPRRPRPDAPVHPAAASAASARRIGG